MEGAFRNADTELSGIHRTREVTLVGAADWVKGISDWTHTLPQEGSAT